MRHEEVGRGAITVVSLMFVASVVLFLFGGFFNGCIYQGVELIGLEELFVNPDKAPPVEEKVETRKRKKF